MRIPLRSPGFTTLLLIALAAPRALAADAMTNKDVIRLVTGGVPHTVILQKVRTASTNFDVSVDALVELAAKNVPPAIIQAMIEQTSGTHATSPSTASDERLYSVRASHHRTAVKHTSGFLVLYTSHLRWNPDQGESRQLFWKSLKSLCYEPTPATLFARHSLRVVLMTGEEVFFREDSTFTAGETNFKQLYEIFAKLQTNVPCIPD